MSSPEVSKSVPSAEIYEDAAGEHRWRLKAGNGEVVAQGEGHTSTIDAMRALDRVAVLFAEWKDAGGPTRDVGREIPRHDLDSACHVCKGAGRVPIGIELNPGYQACTWCSGSGIEPATNGEGVSLTPYNKRELELEKGIEPGSAFSALCNSVMQSPMYALCDLEKRHEGRHTYNTHDRFLREMNR